MKPVSFSAWEVIGIGIPNPRGVCRYPVPENLSPAELAEVEEAIDELDRKEALEIAKKYLYQIVTPRLIAEMNQELARTGYKVDPYCRAEEGDVRLIKIDNQRISHFGKKTNGNE